MIDDVKVIVIPVGNWGAIQLEVTIFGYYASFFRTHLIRYSAATAIQINGTMASSSFTSEDDQRAYEEWEERIDAVDMRLDRITDKLKFSGTAGQDKELDNFIKRGKELITTLSTKKPKRGALLKEADKLIEMLDKYSGL
ncbi:MAG: hypothetical protein JO007_16460 [Alphaproteobacteria bacterium]|nr:hypothetical protein [Alphaproteobacteria bacterium]